MDIAYLTIAKLGRAYDRRELSPVEVTRALLDRVAAHDGKLHSFIRVTEEVALAAAKAAEAELMAGRRRGPMHGIPYGLKDIVETAGIATTGHSKLRRDHVPQHDAEIVRRLKEGGAILLGKLATWEFALGGPSFDLPWPPARNPWDRDRLPGGSSSGPGAAVAAGFMPAAIGTDTGGSIRGPAAFCGIAGLKPTYGRVSRRGVFPNTFTMDHIGPMTRSAEDIALMLQVIAGFDPADPGSADVAVPDYTLELERGVKGLRIGVIRHFYTQDVAADPEQVAQIDGAAALLARQGAEVREITLPALADFSACGQIILAAESYAVHERWLKQRPGDYGARARERLLAGAGLSAAHYLQAVRWRQRLKAQTLAAFAGLDVALTASSMDPACRIDDAAALATNYWRQARMPFNVTGQPGLVIPSGFAKNGLPLSLQIVGQPFGEAMCYRVAQAYEAATGWTKRHPTL